MYTNGSFNMSKGKSKSKWLGRLVVGFVIVIALTTGALAYFNSQHTPRVLPGTKVGEVELGGMTSAEAKVALEKWWATKSGSPVRLAAKGLVSQPKAKTAAELGAQFDLEATLEELPYDDFWFAIQNRLDSNSPRPKKEIDPVVTFDASAMDDIRAFVAKNIPPNRPAKITYENGTIVRQPEQAGMALDEEKFAGLVAQALAGESELEIPLIAKPKRIPDSALEQIVGEMSTFSTTFSAGKVARSANIKLAAERLNGLILMPGEKFSFNGTLGQRTTAKGFKVAGVYVSGRHDFDVGGGICQVSTTLYNAALLADLAVPQRSNHSLPVPYVPLGRDAAVSYPNPDLQIVNNRDIPIAIVSRYEPGKLHFTILGKPENLEVKFERRAAGSWSNGEKVVHDGSLGYGVRKVIEAGGSGHKVETIKIVFRDGVEVSRKSLGTSVYRGSPRIIAVNKNAKPPVAAPATSGPGDGPATVPSKPPVAPANTGVSPATGG